MFICKKYYVRTLTRMSAFQSCWIRIPLRPLFRVIGHHRLHVILTSLNNFEPFSAGIHGSRGQWVQFSGMRRIGAPKASRSPVRLQPLIITYCLFMHCSLKLLITFWVHAVATNTTSTRCYYWNSCPNLKFPQNKWIHISYIQSSTENNCSYLKGSFIFEATNQKSVSIWRHTPVESTRIRLYALNYL